MAKTAKCPCGRPLHYTDPMIERIVGEFVAVLGEHTTVTVGLRSYRVSRHYIALHGIRARDLPRLARRGIVEQVTRA